MRIIKEKEYVLVSQIEAEETGASIFSSLTYSPRHFGFGTDIGMNNY